MIRPTEQAQTEVAQSIFLQAYSHLGKLSQAAKVAGISIKTVESWQHRDIRGFQKKLKEAQQEYLEYWESVMDERLENPQGNRGSDPLLMFKLKALAPEKYREDAKAPEVVGVALFEKLVESANKSLTRQKPELMPPEEQTE